MERRPVRCAIYTRQSVARPDDTDFTSCDAQREACLELVRAHAPEGWVPLEERFDDAGESGATIDRPALTRLLDRIAAGTVDRVVVHRLDRLTRSVRDWAQLVGVFRRRGTGLTIVAGDVHLGDLAMSDLVLNVLATFAGFERELIGERLRDARAALRSRGIRNAGRVPFGYSADPLSRQLVVRPEQAAVVKRMFEMAAAGAPPSAIATWFNTQGETHRHALDERRPWQPKSVLRILSNHVYVGRMGGVADAHDAIVDDELFSRARSAVNARRTRAPSRRPAKAGDVFLLRHLLRCVHCDRLMTTSSSRTLPDPPLGPKPPRGPMPPRYYRCRGRNSCRGTQVAAEDIERRVLAWFRKPTGDISPEASFVLTRYAPIWEVLFPEAVRRAVAQLVWEVRWDGPKNEFAVVLDETAIAEEHAKIVRNDEERASRPKPRRGRTKRRRARAGPLIARLLFGLFPCPESRHSAHVATRKPSVTSYREDPLYPRIARAVEAQLRAGKVVTPVDVLVGMELLTREQLEDWRCGRIPYLERVINCNLTRLGRLLRILRFHAHALNLKPSWTAYMRWGKGPKQRLRFSKTGDPKVEEAYATHFVWPGEGPFQPPVPKEPAA